MDREPTFWHVFNDAMNYQHRISGWWLFNIIIWMLLVGSLIGRLGGS